MGVTTHTKKPEKKSPAFFFFRGRDVIWGVVFLIAEMKEGDGMASKWNVQEQGAKRRRSNQNQNRKSTDTNLNSGKTSPKIAPKQAAKPRTVYYKSKDDAKPVYRNPVKQKTAIRTRYTGKGRTTPKLSEWYAQPKQAAQPKAKPKNEWGVDFGNDFNRDQWVRRLENYTPEFRVKDEKPSEQMRTDLAPGSKYRMRNWLSSRARNRQEDRGSTLAQAKRLASLYQAVDPVTKGFTREQAGELHRQIQNAPVNLQELFIKYGDRLSPMVDLTPGPDDVLPEDQAHAYFSHWTGKTYGEPDTIAEDSRHNVPYRTLWHEYGHNLDWLAGDNGKPKHPYYTSSHLVGETPQHLNEMVVGEVDRSLRDYWSKVRLDESPFDPKTALVDFGMDIQGPYRNAVKNANGLSDMMGLYGFEHGGTVRPIVSGHDADYWNGNLTGKNTESFADLTAASVLGGDSLRYIQAVLPNTYDAYLDMLARMVNGG